jgi:hypothetical protein
VSCNQRGGASQVIDVCWEENLAVGFQPGSIHRDFQNGYSTDPVSRAANADTGFRSRNRTGYLVFAQSMRRKLTLQGQREDSFHEEAGRRQAERQIQNVVNHGRGGYSGKSSTCRRGNAEV